MAAAVISWLHANPRDRAALSAPSQINSTATMDIPYLGPPRSFKITNPVHQGLLEKLVLSPLVGTDGSPYMWQPRKVVVNDVMIAFTQVDDDRVIDHIPLPEVDEVRVEEESVHYPANIRSGRSGGGVGGSRSGARKQSIEKVPTVQKGKGEKTPAAKSGFAGTVFEVKTAHHGHNSGRSYRLKADTPEECDSWIQILTAEVKKAKARVAVAESSFVRIKKSVQKTYKSDYFQMSVAALIIINFVFSISAAEVLPSKGSSLDRLFETIEDSFTWVFAVELMCNMTANWYYDFVGDWWNIFDTIVIGASLLALWSDGPGLNMLRFIRVFRVLRLFKKLHSLRRIINALTASVIPMVNAFAVLFLVTSIYAILAVELYREQSPTLFGSFTISMFTMFQICTLDDWGETTRSLSGDKQSVSLSTGVFFVSFVVIVGIVILNVVVAVLLDEFVESVTVDREEKVNQLLKKRQEQEKSFGSPLDPLLQSLAGFNTSTDLTAKIEQLYIGLDIDQNGFLSYDDLKEGLRKMEVTPHIHLSEEDYHLMTYGKTWCDEFGNLPMDEFERVMRDQLKLYVQRQMSTAMIAAHAGGSQIGDVLFVLKQLMITVEDLKSDSKATHEGLSSMGGIVRTGSVGSNHRINPSPSAQLRRRSSSANSPREHPPINSDGGEVMRKLAEFSKVLTKQGIALDEMTRALTTETTCPKCGHKNVKLQEKQDGEADSAMQHLVSLLKAENPHVKILQQSEMPASESPRPDEFPSHDSKEILRDVSSSFSKVEDKQREESLTVPEQRQLQTSFQESVLEISRMVSAEVTADKAAPPANHGLGDGGTVDIASGLEPSSGTDTEAWRPPHISQLVSAPIEVNPSSFTPFQAVADPSPPRPSSPELQVVPPSTNVQETLVLRQPGHKVTPAAEEPSNQAMPTSFGRPDSRGSMDSEDRELGFSTSHLGLLKATQDFEELLGGKPAASQQSAPSNSLASEQASALNTEVNSFNSTTSQHISAHPPREPVVISDSHAHQVLDLRANFSADSMAELERPSNSLGTRFRGSEGLTIGDDIEVEHQGSVRPQQAESARQESTTVKTPPSPLQLINDMNYLKSIGEARRLSNGNAQHRSAPNGGSVLQRAELPNGFGLSGLGASGLSELKLRQQVAANPTLQQSPLALSEASHTRRPSDERPAYLGLAAGDIEGSLCDTDSSRSSDELEDQFSRRQKAKRKLRS